MTGFTEKDNEEINQAKNILAKIFYQMNISRQAGIIAMTEMIVSTLCQGPIDIKELDEYADMWYKLCFLKVVKAQGPNNIKAFQELMALDKKLPGAAIAIATALAKMDNSVEVKLVHTKPGQSFEEAIAENIFDGPTPSPTKH